MKFFDEKRARGAFEYVINNQFSDFYRKKYKKAGLELPEDFSIDFFQSLPFLTRDELVETPLSKRTFVAGEEIVFAGYTSGTSSQKPLITLFSDVPNYYFEPSLGLSATRPLIVLPALCKNFGHTFIQQCRQAKNKVAPIFADYQNLANSAILAEAGRCDSVYATPTQASLIHEHIKKYYDPSVIKLLALSGEILTDIRREELKRMYPNASIANLYASSEIGQFVLFPCEKIMRAGENRFHILEDALAALELIDGELVVSYGLNKAMPLIRYKTGDYFEEISELCSCGTKGPIFKWSHRSGVDRLRLNGVEFTVALADKAFGNITYVENPNYQIHFYGGNAEATDRPRIIVEIKDEILTKDKRRADFLAPLVAEEIKDKWAVSGSANLRTLVEQRLFDGPEVVFVSEFSFPGVKIRRFVNHLT